MKILFFLSHPAHYHLFINTYKILNESHNCIIAIKTKDILENLLNSANVSYYNLQRKNLKRNNKLKLYIDTIGGLLLRDIRLIKLIYKNKPDLMIGTEWAIAHVGWLLGIPSIIVNEDDTAATPENKYFYPFAKTLLLPECCDIEFFNNKRISYAGYHELAYLHPNRYVPLKNKIEQLFRDEKNYIIIRLVGLNASHDIDKKGLSFELINKLIEKYGDKFNIFLSSEITLPPQYLNKVFPLEKKDMHHALSYAALFIGDSSTMIAEAAILGTPAIRFSDFVGKLSYLEELEHKYGLTYGIKTSEPEKLLYKVDKLLAIQNLKDEWHKRRMKMLSEKIDVTAFMVWFIENYPQSVKIMKENPAYQYRFK
ncbi:MAG: DUF354 domain-containing protein [Ignavibacterium sp.]|nr:DUF354 domain-containing protein [Ignavibacterium sp.]